MHGMALTAIGIVREVRELFNNENAMLPAGGRSVKSTIFCFRPAQRMNNCFPNPMLRFGKEDKTT
mgnify:CR=1 FL=1